LYCIAFALIFVAAAALSCHTAQLDKFNRLTGAQHAAADGFCLLSNSYNTLRNWCMVAAAGALGTAVAAWVQGEACRAYSKFLPDGISALYARCLLRQLGVSCSMQWVVTTRLQQESGARRLKAAVLLLCLAGPVLCGVISTLPGVGFSACAVRLTIYQINITDVPTWMSYDKLVEAKWNQGIYSTFPTLATSDLMRNALKVRPSPSAAELQLTEQNITDQIFDRLDDY
jgi:hypothetical protein